MTGTILIDGLEIYAHHGAFAEEARLGQRFTLDLALSADLRAPAASDSLDDAIDYGKVALAASEVLTTRRFHLLEAAADAVGRELLARFPQVEAVLVTLRKPGPPIPAVLRSAGVRLEVRREG